MSGAGASSGCLSLVGATLPVIVGVLAGALLGPSLHGWQPACPVASQGAGAGAAAGAAAGGAGTGGALLQRTVALHPLSSRRLPPWGVRFDPTDTGTIAVIDVEPELSAATGLTAGDIVVSLAGVPIAGDHDASAQATCRCLQFACLWRRGVL